MIVQLASYGILWWLVFACMAFFAARLGRFWGIVIGQVLIAVIVCVLDVQWIQTEIHRSGWPGYPDQDAIFMLGVVVRVVLINACLLPVSAGAWLSRGRKAALPVA